MHIRSIHSAPRTATAASAGDEHAGGSAPARRTAPLRVDAQRNLEHVLRAAREVFGELGYGAPMEDVARRARVGVGTVYRRFPSKDVLVRRIAEEETARLTEQAREALGRENEPWQALSRFLRASVASGAGRLLPPGILRVRTPSGHAPDETTEDTTGDAAARLPGFLLVAGEPAEATTAESGKPPEESAAGSGSAGTDIQESAAEHPDSGAVELLEVVGQLVERARAAGELRADVTVADVLLVISTAAPSLPDAAQQEAASARLLDILLEGLRPAVTGPGA